MEIIRLDNTASTNDFALELHTDTNVCVMSDYQSKGKGMGTNTWESEAGKNLLFSILVHPTWLDVRNQFLLSMTHAIALREVLAQYVTVSELLTIKWPNDIYYGDKKISGTRIDANLNGASLQDVVIGTGINVNQKAFYSDAPNPVSLTQITEEEYDRDELLNQILASFEKYMTALFKEEYQYIIELYHKYLYRGTGMHHYRDKDGDFTAEIVSVAPSGILSLRRQDGMISKYECKELVFLHD